MQGQVCKGNLVCVWHVRPCIRALACMWHTCPCVRVACAPLRTCGMCARRTCMCVAHVPLRACALKCVGAASHARKGTYATRTAHNMQHTALLHACFPPPPPIAVSPHTTPPHAFAPPPLSACHPHHALMRPALYAPPPAHALMRPALPCHPHHPHNWLVHHPHNWRGVEQGRGMGRVGVVAGGVRLGFQGLVLPTWVGAAALCPAPSPTLPTPRPCSTPCHSHPIKAWLTPVVLPAYPPRPPCHHLTTTSAPPYCTTFSVPPCRRRYHVVIDGSGGLVGWGRCSLLLACWMGALLPAPGMLAPPTVRGASSRKPLLLCCYCCLLLPAVEACSVYMD